MRRLIAILALLFSTSSPSHAGILGGITNATVRSANGALLLTRKDKGAPIRIQFAPSQALGVQREGQAWWVLPMNAEGTSIQANSGLWLLPTDADSPDASWYVDLHGTSASAERTNDGTTVTLQMDSVTLQRAEARPHSDIFGDRFTLEMEAGPALEHALASFYWGTMLPSVVERTMASKYPYNEGYVLSTLDTSQYAGSYPAVDHEFQIMGRLAVSSPLELDLVRRMIELQLQLMKDDPEHLSRAPTSVQPDGRREYHIRRDSIDHRENAAMFPVTGNIEVLQEAWQWFQATKDRAWLASHVEGLERAAGWVSANTDQYGRVWSDVYYEDQVIKDGRVTQAQAFAARAFEQLASIEETLDRSTQAATYHATSQKLAAALIAPLPDGYWDAQHRRFVDWVDRNGQAHDHVHLLANTLPVTLGYASPEQAAAVRDLVTANNAEFERFPSFLSAHIEDYTKSEIGIAGPYDLSAAGRYWYWDAAYRAAQNQNATLLAQLQAVAAEAQAHNGFMDERYDMDHVYYVDGKHAHGAGKYYEYPNVFAAVLISKYLGLSATTDADLLVAPHLANHGSVQFQIPAYGLRYSWDDSGFNLTNLSDRTRHFKVDLSGIAPPGKHFEPQGATAPPTHGPSLITLGAHEHIQWTLKDGAE